MPAPETIARTEITIRAVVDDGDVALINAARARASLPAALAPTHVIERGGEVVGFASLGAIPVLGGWLDEQEVSDREGLRCIQELEEFARSRGEQFLKIFCTEDCHWLPFMERIGYRGGQRVFEFTRRL